MTQDIQLIEVLEEKYLSYALSTIMNRALPDLRDGLKPVHRRIIYGMYMLKLNPETGFKKCARVVGDVIGKYHPHGEQAVYDAMVRLAQDYNVRYPLVEGQGNFGNIDGDNAAAMRYTEAKLTKVAVSLLEGIEEEAVSFRPNYDNEEVEPTILPGSFPYLLANGASGIAVGMATNIPPHNVGELCDTLIALIDNPEVSTEEIMQHLKGPDFPTGGELIENKDDILTYFKTGKGNVILQAKWHKENISKSLFQIVITEIPYQVQKSRLIKRIAELIDSKSLPLIADIKDESADDVRIIIEPRQRNCDPDKVMASLFLSTDLQIRYNINMNVLSQGQKPVVLGIKDILQEWLEHQKVICIKRAQFKLNKTKKRLEILSGLLIVYLNIDKVIHIIRFEDKPKQQLMIQFDLTDIQAEAILNMRLRSLRKLEETEIRKEHDNLLKLHKQLQNLLSSSQLQWLSVRDSINNIQKVFGHNAPNGARRTTFTQVEVVKKQAHNVLIEKEPITVTLSQKGWLRSFKGHLEDTTNLQYKQGDKEAFTLKAYSTDKIIFISNNGKSYCIDAYKLPSGRGFGDPIRLLTEMEEGRSIAQMLTYDEAAKYIIYADNARGFIVEAKTLLSNTKNGKQIINLMTNENCLDIVKIVGEIVLTVGYNAKILAFYSNELPTMPRGKGVRLQKYKDSSIANLFSIELNKDIEIVTKKYKTTIKATDIHNFLGKRAQAGVSISQNIMKKLL